MFVKVRLCLGAALAAAALGAPAVVAGWFGILGPEVARAHSPGPDGAPPTLAYACGNTFVVTNVGRSPITATFRVAGVREEGLVRVPAAPEEDPYSSEVLIETKRTGTVDLLEGDRRVASEENGGVPCAPPAPVAAQVAVAAAPIDVGAWSAPFSWPIVAVHLHLLPNGQVVSWANMGQPRVWNPATGAFTTAAAPVNLFCAGHAFLPDGRLLVAGGHIALGRGLPDMHLYSPGAGWVSAPPMQRGRWYPTVTIMGNGEAVILAGRDESRTHVPLPEVWSTASAAPRVLTGASRLFPYYPRAFAAPNGRLFYAGEQSTSLYLNTAGAGSWSTVGTRRFANREYGSAVMYQPGRILYAGGGRTTNTAEVINLTQGSPTWQSTGSMAFARRQHNLTLLPTGEVLATAGVAGAGFNDLSKAVLAAEIWNPATGTWRTVANAAIARGYHGTAILLPDGRVLQSGSGGGAGAPNQRNAELYSPPYLFAGPRPTITGAPATALYGSTFRVTTPDAAAIAKVSLIRLGSVTHAFDMNQRYQALGFTADATGLTVTAPTDSDLTPPGHYMLFILKGSGVPSVAKIVQIL